MRWTVPLVLGLALAGCFGDKAPAQAPVATGPLVEGWVVDEAIVPIPDAVIRLAGLGVEGRSDAAGHFQLQGPSGVDLVVVIEAAGFVAQSRVAIAASGAHHWFNVTLARAPLEQPYDELLSFQGVLRCGIVVTTQEDPSRPHEHQGVRCSQIANDTSNQWEYGIPANTTGIVIEVDWDPQSEVAQAMVLKVITQATGEVLAFTEGTPLVRAQLSSVKLALELQAGHDTLVISLEPGAGTGNHEHGAAGAYLQQSFTAYATAFFNGPVPPAYTVANR